MKRHILYVVIAATVAVFAGCSDSDTQRQASQATGHDAAAVVYVVNYPLQYFAERVGGDEVDIVFPAPGDGDPAFWKPTANEVTAFQNADLILLNGADYAKWVGRVSLPPSKLVNTSAGFKDRYIVVEEAVTHSHGPTGDHAHTGTAFTTWIDLGQAAEQARAVADAFGRAWPEHKDTFDANFRSLESELMALDTELESIVGGDDRPMAASHPVYQYFARRYRVDVYAVMWEPEEVPTEKQWAELKKVLEKHPAKWMIWEGEPNPDSVERLGAMGVESVVFDPCGNRPDEGNFLTVMRQNVDRLGNVYR
jgi:zinc transport system substrate-binding protein